jgi:hypothetical protein
VEIGKERLADVGTLSTTLTWNFYGLKNNTLISTSVSYLFRYSEGMRTTLCYDTIFPQRFQTGRNICFQTARVFFLFVCLFGETGLNLGLHASKTGTLPLEPHLQFILLWLFW